MANSSHFTIRRVAALLGLAIGLMLAPPASADDISTFVANGAAIGGTDPVAYFKEGRPVAGSDQWTASWDGVTWKFSSEANRDAFAAAPEKYAPAYGGWCATAASFGKKFSVDPKFWKIVDGTLYLNNNIAAQEHFLADEAGTISRADTNWSKIRAVPAFKL